MCDRFSLTVDVYELQEQFRINKTLASVANRSAILPTNDTVVVVGRSRERRLVEARWGLFPFWAKDSVSADFEGLLGKPAFKRMLSKQRCVIPCSAFYAHRQEGKVRSEVRFEPANGGLFGLAGLYEERVDSRGDIHRSCTIVTSRPNRLVAGYSASMPVILDPEATGEWLQPVYGEDSERIQPFEPYDERYMKMDTTTL